MARKKRVEEPAEHENHERWLVTYADLITLMMVLFIVLFAVSQVDQKKFAALKDGLSSGFGEDQSVLAASDAILEAGGEQPILPATLAATGGSPQLAARVERALAETERLRQGRVRADAVAEAERLLALRERLDQAIAARGLESDVRTRVDDRGLVISLVSRHIVFRADLATLTARGVRIVDSLGPVLAQIPDDMEISGHTNQVPVEPAFFATDWDLSSARAVTVLRRLSEVHGIADDRLHAAAYGNTVPLIDPSRDDAPALNKRVDVIVLSTLGGEAATLLEAAALDADGAAGDTTEDTAPTSDTDDTDDTEGGGTLAAAPTAEESTP